MMNTRTHLCFSQCQQFQNIDRGVDGLCESERLLVQKKSYSQNIIFCVKVNTLFSYLCIIFSLSLIFCCDCIVHMYEVWCKVHKVMDVSGIIDSDTKFELWCIQVKIAWASSHNPTKQV
jgi:hypothetical protein